MGPLYGGAVSRGVFNARVIHPDTLEGAARVVEATGSHKGGTAIMASKAVLYAVALEGVGYREANILKQAMLALGGDAATEKGVVDFTSEASDLVLLGTARHFGFLTEKLASQPWKCGAIGAEIAETLENYQRRDFILRFPGGEMALDRTRVMGVLNVTPDSFSDDGRFLDPEAAVKHALRMAEEGADLIDVGGESSRPFSDPVSQEEELARVLPVLEGLEGRAEVPLSIDTRRPKVAEAALKAGATMVNDITGLGDEAMRALVADHGVPAVLMHMQGDPKTMQEDPTYGDVVADILRFFRERIAMAEAAGIPRDRLVVDPGIGFGKTAAHNLQILRRLSEFRSLGLPLLMGASRKSFIGKVLDAEVDDRLEGSLAAAAAAVLGGARLVRAHDVRATVRTVRLLDAIAGAE